MHRRRLLLVLVVIAIIAVAAVVAYTSPSWLPRSTTLTVSPSSYSMVAGQEMVLTASVYYGSAPVSGGTITWQVAGGSLNRNTGTTVVFTAPSLTGNQTFMITASFGGMGVYQPSSSHSMVTVSSSQAVATSVTVTPPTFQLHGGDSQLLTASVLSGGTAIDVPISWSISPSGLGSLSSTSGTSVTYTSPTVQSTTSVTITATFGGNAQYKASSATSSGSLLPAGMAGKKATRMTVSPSTFTLPPTGTQVLTASVNVTVSGSSITWSLSPANAGTLSSSTGTSVTYTAPNVQQNTSVSITATYAGDDTYLGTSGVSSGVVTPSSNAASLYTLKFTSATLTNVSLHGPIILNSTSVTMITADYANLVNINLTRFGLTAPSMTVDKLVLYTTYVSGFSQALGGTLAIEGSQSTNMGPIATASLSGFTISFLRMEGASANLTGMVSVGQYVGGAEPYIPSVITAPTVSMSNIYSITGPTTWKSEVNMVSNVTAGRIDLPQFALQHPSSYTIDRHSKNYTATIEWSLTASSATAIKVSAYIVYFKVTGGEMVTIIATGSDNPNNLIPFGLNTGGSFGGLDANVQPVYFSASQLQLGSFVIAITPHYTSGTTVGLIAGPTVLGANVGVVPRLLTKDLT